MLANNWKFNDSLSLSFRYSCSCNKSIKYTAEHLWILNCQHTDLASSLKFTKKKVFFKKPNHINDISYFNYDFNRSHSITMTDRFSRLFLNVMIRWMVKMLQIKLNSLVYFEWAKITVGCVRFTICIVRIAFACYLF